LIAIAPVAVSVVAVVVMVVMTLTHIPVVATVFSAADDQWAVEPEG
jgi:type II secretory pathway component PulF